LPGNVQGVVVQERLILAASLVNEDISGDHQVVKTLQGQELNGLEYTPLYEPEKNWGVEPMGFITETVTDDIDKDEELIQHLHTHVRRFLPTDQPPTRRVIMTDFVALTEGTGIVHIAPAFGGDDYEAGKRESLLLVRDYVDLQGMMKAPGTSFDGLFVKKANEEIQKDLQNRGLIYRSERITHTYPFCWRCDSPLLYYAKPSWYIRTTAVKEKLLSGNQQINWHPEHIRDGRFGDWLNNNVDWAITRERYWGTPWPVWRCDVCGEVDCVGSREELQSKPDYSGPEGDFDLHRPYIDDVTYRCDKCGGTMRRLPEVMDCWFDSGAMPVAQWHYPFENRDKIESQNGNGRFYPADYICEAVDQTRGWFYSLHALATLLNACDPASFPEGICYRNVICLGLILDAKGEKMSKSKGNVVDPWEVLNRHGADATRWYLFTAGPPGNPRRFSGDLVAETVRKFLLTLWNTYSFFVIYANIDGFDPKTSPSAELSDLDRWAISELNQLIETVDQSLSGYDPTTAGRAIADFVDVLSNWYVRRSRRRFWKPVLSTVEGSEYDSDKAAAYQTLYTCLTTVAKLMAPFTPFIAEELYQNLVRTVDEDAPESVHLADFPTADESLIDRQLSEDVRLAMRLSSLGRNARSKAGIKVRQPLEEVKTVVRNEVEERTVERLQDQLKEELNVKAVRAISKGSFDEKVNFWDLQIVANRQTVGPKYGSQLPQVEAELATLDARHIAAQKELGHSIHLKTGAVLDPDDILVNKNPPEGFSLAEEGGYAVAISTKITDELEQEGQAREIVRLIQNMRRNADFNISDYIETSYQAPESLRAVFEEHADYIKQETLSTELTEGAPQEGAHTETHKLDGQEIILAVKRVEV
jgi:isoleucyl-tRNA synthetase